MRCPKNVRKVSGEGIEYMKVCGKNFLIVSKNMDEIVTVPCICDTVKKI